MRKIIFDVGACEGHTFVHMCGDPEVEIYAFEPDPNLFPSVEKWAAGNPKYHAFCKVVSDTNGTVDFNICPDWGCSSILPFADNIDETWQVKDPIWGDKKVAEGDGFRYFKHTKVVSVSSIRLDTFIEENQIPHIDILHIDTQGNDLKVLLSLGKYIDIVKSGNIEVASNAQVSLYKGQATKLECVDFLKKHNFEIVSITSNDPFSFEENIAFKR
jgi:FkbM family methyltransferase